MNNIQDITTAVGRENLKWSASSMFAGAWFYRFLLINPYQTFKCNVGGADSVRVLI